MSRVIEFESASVACEASSADKEAQAQRDDEDGEAAERNPGARGYVPLCRAASPEV